MSEITKGREIANEVKAKLEQILNPTTTSTTTKPE